MHAGLTIITLSAEGCFYKLEVKLVVVVLLLFLAAVAVVYVDIKTKMLLRNIMPNNQFATKGLKY